MNERAEIIDQIESFSGPMEVEQYKFPQFPMQQTKTGYTTAVQVQEPRSIVKFDKNVLQEARLAGKSFYYGWHVNTRQGQKWIQGPSIDLAMALVRNYGNCAIDIEVEETATHYVFKAVFVDLETGFTCPRLFSQRKGQNIGMKKDADRAEDIVFQIGQSKAIRNAVIHAMPAWVVDKAIDTAKEAEGANIADPKLTMGKYMAILEPLGIHQDQLEAFYGCNADVFTNEMILEIGAGITALREGRVSPEDLFVVEDTEGKSGERETPEVQPSETEAPPTPSPEVTAILGKRKTGIEKMIKAGPENLPIDQYEAFKKRYKELFKEEYKASENIENSGQSNLLEGMDEAAQKAATEFLEFCMNAKEILGETRFDAVLELLEYESINDIAPENFETVRKTLQGAVDTADTGND